MPRLRGLFAIVVICFLFSACQKEPVVSDRDYRTLGTSAYDLLSSSIYTSLKIQISYMPGYEPDASSVASLKAFLETYLNKPDGITVVLQSIPASGKSYLTLNDLVSIERSNRFKFTGGATIAVHILIADADYSDPTDLAISYWNTSFCLFGKTIYSKSGSSGQLSHSDLVSTLFKHEFGHLLGLVGQGSPEQTPHRDDINGAHCNNPLCLMYYSIETNANYSIIPAFDARCVEDLKANGSK